MKRYRKSDIYILTAILMAFICAVCLLFGNIRLKASAEKLIYDENISEEIKNTDFTLPVIYINSYDFDSLTGLNHVPAFDGDYTPKPIATTRDISVYNSQSGINNLTDIPTETYKDVYMSLRGKSSARYQPKKSFKIRFSDKNDKGVDTEFAGFGADSYFILYSPYIDRSLIRNWLGISFQQQAIEWAPDIQLCEVFVNRDGTDVNMADDYCGVYMLTEKIKTGKNRLNISEYVTAENTENQLTDGGGLIWKADWYYDDRDTEIPVKELTRDVWYVISSLEESKNTAEEIECAKNEVLTLDSILRDGTDEELSTYFDLHEIARVMLIDEVMKNHEGFAGSTYFYRDKGGKVKVVQWDFDLGTGNWYVGDILAEYADCEIWEKFWVMSFWEIAKNFVRHENFREILAEEWDLLRKDVLSDENIVLLIADAEKQLDGAWQRNDAKYGDSFINPPFSTLSNGLSNSQEERQFIQDFLLNRAKWIDENLQSFLDNSEYQPASEEAVG